MADTPNIRAEKVPSGFEWVRIYVGDLHVSSIPTADDEAVADELVRRINGPQPSDLPDGYHVAPNGETWALPGAMSVKGWDWWDEDGEWLPCSGGKWVTVDPWFARKVRRTPEPPPVMIPADTLSVDVLVDARDTIDAWAPDAHIIGELDDAIAKARAEAEAATR